MRTLARSQAGEPPAPSSSPGTAATTAARSCPTASTGRASTSRREHRTIVLPNPIRMDATPPLIRSSRFRPRVFSPNGDSPERLRPDPVPDEREGAGAPLRRRRPAKTRVKRFVRAGKLDWGGQAARSARSPGRHRIRLRALDFADQPRAAEPRPDVVVRYIELRPHALHVKTGRRFGFRVITDAKRYAVHFGSLGTVRRSGRLLSCARRRRALRACASPTDGHVARAIVAVTPVTAELARAGGVLGASGSRCCSSRPRAAPAARRARRLGARVAPARRLPRAARAPAAARRGRGRSASLLAAGGAFVLRRWPFVLPFAVLACIAARIHVHVGSTEANLLVPMYAVVAAAALLLAWELLQGDTRATRARPGRVAARRVRRLGRASRSSGRRTCARARSSCSSSTCRSACSRSRSRAWRGAG